MQVTLDAGTILMGLLTVLFGVIEILAMLWIRNVQKGLDDSQRENAMLKADIATLRETLARDYAPRSENRDLREEFSAGLKSIDQKLADINNKLDRKQDKP